jgi:general L-amino acid transport system permease protein
MSSQDTKQAEKVFFWYDPVKRGIIYQVLTLLAVGLVSYYLLSNVQANLERQSIATGFGFLEKESSFEIGESLIEYSSADTYARALLVGVLNTVKVSFVGIVLTVILGAFIGIARLSTNWLVSKIASAYIEFFQNIPILLQLFFFYALFYEVFPSPKHALNPVVGVFVTNRGIAFGVPASHEVHGHMLIIFGLACVITYFLNRWAKSRQARTGQTFPVLYSGLGIILGLPLLTWLVFGAPTAMNTPRLTGFNFEGGMTLSPEFVALLFGLVLYTAAFVAEIVRAGIQSISKGQTEAAMSIGLRPGQVMKLVIMPQALRVIVPPLTSQMLNLTKNSSLAVAIGYPDFVAVAGTSINQTGQAIEGVAMIMLVYLTFSLSTSAFMNWYNKRIALIER